MIVMYTELGRTYALADDGRVLGRSDGPKGWNYSGGWIITGFATRWNSRFQVSLEAALSGVDFGHGFICDIDHGTHRRSNQRVANLYRIDDNDEQAAQLRQSLGIPEDQA